MELRHECIFQTDCKACGITHVSTVKTITATSARAQLYSLIDAAVESHEPLQITGKRGNAVLVSEEDWRAVQETLHLLAIPGMRESIVDGMATDVSECSETVDL